MGQRAAAGWMPAGEGSKAGGGSLYEVDASSQRSLRDLPDRFSASAGQEEPFDRDAAITFTVAVVGLDPPVWRRVRVDIFLYLVRGLRPLLRLTINNCSNLFIMHCEYMCENCWHMAPSGLHDAQAHS